MYSDILRFASHRSSQFLLATLSLVLSATAVYVWRERPTATDIARVDGELIAAVLIDLVSYHGGDSPLSQGASSPKKILFSTQAIRHVLTSHDVFYGQQAALSHKLWSGRRNASEQAAASLASRSFNHDSVGIFETHDQRIRIWRLASIEIRILLPNPSKGDRCRHGPPDILATDGSQLFD